MTLKTSRTTSRSFSRSRLDWHTEQLLAAGSRKIILMSHHQLFSSFATIGRGQASFQNPFLTQNLADWRRAGVKNIVAWLWGHEHLARDLRSGCK